jgi:hypothetical protein
LNIAKATIAAMARIGKIHFFIFFIFNEMNDFCFLSIILKATFKTLVKEKLNDIKSKNQSMIVFILSTTKTT